MRKVVIVLDDNMNQLADALNGHQVTDDEGGVMGEETSIESTAAQEENTVEEAPEVQQEPQTPKSEDDDEFGVDDAGKRYVPEKRFKEIYGEKKRLERELEQARKQSQTQPVERQTKLPSVDDLAPVKIDKAEALEVEILREKWPQFDPDSPEYTRELDEMGGEIYQANPGITRLEAARRALTRAKKLGMVERSFKDEARLVKTQQADQGITGRVVNRQPKEVDFNSMTLEEKEEYLRAIGEWDKV